MKITAILGSPRKNGNSDTVAGYFLDEIEKQGGLVERWRLYDMNFSGCVACQACKKGMERCVLNDDLTPLMASLQESDTVVIATPIYYFDAAAKVRSFIERWYEYLLPDYHKNGVSETRFPCGKGLVLIVSQGAAMKYYNDFTSRLAAIFQWYHFLPPHIIRVCDSYPIDTAKTSPIIRQQAESVAKRVWEGSDPIQAVPSYNLGIDHVN